MSSSTGQSATRSPFHRPLPLGTKCNNIRQYCVYREIGYEYPRFFDRFRFLSRSCLRQPETLRGSRNDDAKGLTPHKIQVQSSHWDRLLDASSSFLAACCFRRFCDPRRRLLVVTPPSPSPICCGTNFAINKTYGSDLAAAVWAKPPTIRRGIFSKDAASALWNAGKRKLTVQIHLF